MAEAPTPQGLLNSQSFGTIAPYEPNMVEKAQGLLAQGLIKVGYNPRDAYVQANKIINTQGDVGAADFTPIASDLIGAQDAYDMGVDAKRAFDRDEYLKALGYGAGSAATGILSGLGVLGTVAPPVDKGIDAVRAGVKKATGLLDSDNLITGAERDANFKNWFGDSKVVDEAGEPLTVYHGTDRGGFNSFDPYEVGSNTSNATHGFYFSDDYGTAKTYSRGQHTIEPHSFNKEDFFKNPSDFDVDLEDHGDYWTATNHEGYVYEGDTKEEVLNELLNTGGLEDVSGVYEVNLSIKDPLEVDFEGRSWDGLNKYGEYDGFEGMPEWEQIAKDGGYDGVIASNVSDEGSYGRGYQGSDGKTYITFKPTQIKSIHNRGTYNPKDANILKGIAPIAGAGLLGAGMMRQEDQQPQQGILN
jgi:hypothetical protein